MFDRTDIRAAVEAGAISDEGARRFEAFLKARNDPERMLDPENLRFLSNFNDVFLTIGIVVLMVGLSALSGVIVTSLFDLQSLRNVNSPAELDAVMWRIRLSAAFMPVPVLAGSWLLAEYFCGKRRLLLPSMALASFVVLGAAGIGLALFTPTPDMDGERSFWAVMTTAGYAAFGAGLLAAAVFFWRFRLPFSLFLLAGSAAGLFYTAIAQVAGMGEVFSGAAMLAVGLVTLTVAILFDMKDPTRSTRSSDHAFWLHMAAAPQIIIGLRNMVLGSGFVPAGAADASVMLAVLLAFALISLALNRRALIVSGLLTFGTALAVLVNQFGGGGINTLMYTALIIGASIVLLGGGWRTARRTILKVFPQQGAFGRIFPPEPA